MTKPAVWTLPELLDQDLGAVTLWVTPAVRTRARTALPWPLADESLGIPPGTDTLVAVGGGSLLDLAKRRRHEAAPAVRLVAIPSIWGSGAEASPIVVFEGAERKEGRKDEGYLPDARVEWPELASDLPGPLVRFACGDTYAHAIEAFLSPLAHDGLRSETAAILDEMLALPLANDPRWFAASVRACVAQSSASVGLIHGIAHTLEPALAREQPAYGWGHARLCAAFLWPVLALAQSASPKPGDYAARYDVDLAGVTARARELFDERDYDAALPTLDAAWGKVLRDPCTRTNCMVVKGEHLAFFSQKAFL
jgi:alcohol dehydrogenase class IV